MRKIFLTGCITILSYLSYAQVGINTEPVHSSAAIDMSDSKKGVLAPRIALTHERDRSIIAEPKKGLLVFNTTENTEMSSGYYYWNNEKWEPFYNSTEKLVQNVSENIFASSLGYVPSGDYEYALTELSYYGATSLKRECYQFTDNYEGAIPHTYCGYTMDGPVNWEQAFHFSKYLKGYLVTITSDAEWNFIKSNLLTHAENSENNIWLGYNSIQLPGNSREYIWVTGEKSTINWSNEATIQANYATGEPNGATGCVYISATTDSSNRDWKNDACNLSEINGKPFNYIIVEFHN